MVLALLYVLDLPDQRSFQHAKEISSMAILLMQLVGRFQVSHMRNYRMQMRMGIHSGMKDAKTILTTAIYSFSKFITRRKNAISSTKADRLDNPPSTCPFCTLPSPRVLCGRRGGLQDAPLLCIRRHGHPVPPLVSALPLINTCITTVWFEGLIQCSHPIQRLSELWGPFNGKLVSSHQFFFEVP